MTVLLLFQSGCLSFSFLIAVAGISNTMLNNSGECQHPYLVPDLRENAFSFPPMHTMLAMGLLYMIFVMLNYAPSMPLC